MYEHKFIKKAGFEWSEIHKKIGRIAVISPGDSDFNEGNFMKQLWFQDEDGVLWLLNECDIRNCSTFSTQIWKGLICGF